MDKEYIMFQFLIGIMIFFGFAFLVIGFIGCCKEIFGKEKKRDAQANVSKADDTQDETGKYF